MPSAPSSANPLLGLAGRMTGAIVFVVVAIFIALIGFSGYVKYELDRAETALASPETQLAPDQQSFNKIRNDLGYSGFLGMAQNYAASHDAAVLPDLKEHLKQASDSFEHMPDKAHVETRQDIQAILATFDAVEQKVEKAATATPPGDFSLQDLAPLYAALPVLDDRVASAIATSRLSEQNQVQFWATLLTIICWGSLIVGAALAAGIYLILRGRNSAPMRALSQSVKNMARGDMRTSIWGMERQDAIGELARAIDMARFHFSQLPDMSLLSEQGPVRIRFEGNTRSLFEAMMRVISRDSEQVHEQAAKLTENVVKQQDTLAHVIDRVEAVLQNVEKRAVSGDQQVRQALQSMLSSAESLKNAQEHAADQLNRIIPFLQERTQGISEIAQITGKQVSSALQALATTERGLRSSAEQSETAIRKFSTTADTLGERMFGAVNLLQASGKVLAETTETIHNRLDEAVAKISSATAPIALAPVAQELDPKINERFGAIVEALESSQAKLQEMLAEQTESARAHIDLLITQSSSLLTQTSTSSQTLSAASDRLRDEQEKMNGLIGKMSALVEAPPPSEEPSQNAIVETVLAPLLMDLQDGFASIKHGITGLQDQVANFMAESAKSIEAAPAETDEQLRDHWYQMAAQIEASRSNLAHFIAEQTDRIETRLSVQPAAPAAAAPANNDFVKEAQSQLELQTAILSELVNTLSLLDAHMQDIRGQLAESQRKAG